MESLEYQNLGCIETFLQPLAPRYSGGLAGLLAFVPGTGEPAILPSLARLATQGTLAIALVRALAGGQMEARRWDGSESSLRPHPSLPIHQIQPEAPILDFPAPGWICLVPGRAFDFQGHRLGRGGGFYDRFLAAHPELYRLGLALPGQLLPRLPAEVWDQRLDALLEPAAVHLFAPPDRQGGDFSGLSEYLLGTIFTG